MTLSPVGNQSGAPIQARNRWTCFMIDKYGNADARCAVMFDSDSRSRCFGARQATRSGDADSMTGSEKTRQTNLRIGGAVARSADGRLHSVTTGRFGGSKLLHQVTNIHSPDTHHHRQQHPARASAPSCSKPTSHHFRRYPLFRCNFATRVSSSATRFTSRTRETISSRTTDRVWSGMPCRSSSIAISP